MDFFFFFFQAEDGIRDATVTGVQTCALPISGRWTRTYRPRGAPRTSSTAVTGTCAGTCSAAVWAMSWPWRRTTGSSPGQPTVRSARTGLPPGCPVGRGTACRLGPVRRVTGTTTGPGRAAGSPLGLLVPAHHAGHARPRHPHRHRRTGTRRSTGNRPAADPVDAQRNPPPLRTIHHQHRVHHRPLAALVELAPPTPSTRPDQPLPPPRPNYPSTSIYITNPGCRTSYGLRRVLAELSIKEWSGERHADQQQGRSPDSDWQPYDEAKDNRASSPL